MFARWYQQQRCSIFEEICARLRMETDEDNTKRLFNLLVWRENEDLPRRFLCYSTGTSDIQGDRIRVEISNLNTFFSHHPNYNPSVLSFVFSFSVYCTHEVFILYRNSGYKSTFIHLQLSYDARYRYGYILCQLKHVQSRDTTNIVSITEKNLRCMFPCLFKALLCLFFWSQNLNNLSFFLCNSLLCSRLLGRRIWGSNLCTLYHLKEKDTKGGTWLESWSGGFNTFSTRHLQYYPLQNTFRSS